MRDRKVAIFFAPIAARLELFRDMTKGTKDCSGQSERFRVFCNITVTFRFPFLSKFRLNGMYGIFSDACLYFSYYAKEGIRVNAFGSHPGRMH